MICLPKQISGLRWSVHINFIMTLLRLSLRLLEIVKTLKIDLKIIFIYIIQQLSTSVLEKDLMKKNVCLDHTYIVMDYCWLLFCLKVSRLHWLRLYLMSLELDLLTNFLWVRVIIFITWNLRNVSLKMQQKKKSFH